MIRSSTQPGPYPGSRIATTGPAVAPRCSDEYRGRVECGQLHLPPITEDRQGADVSLGQLDEINKPSRCGTRIAANALQSSGLARAEANLDARGRDVEPLADGLQIRFLLCPALQECSWPITWIKAPEFVPLATRKHEITHSF